MSSMHEFFTEEELTAEFIDEPGPGDVPPPSEDYDRPEAGFVADNYRGPVARKYEKKVKAVLNVVFRQTVAKESTVPDAAAILMYGPDFCARAGDLANHDPRVRKAIDMITEGSENPYLAFALAAMPLVLQVYRNHEDALNPKGAVQAVRTRREKAKLREPRKIKIPFTKRFIAFRWQLSLPSVHNLTNEPRALVSHVFSDPNIVLAMQKAGVVEVAGFNFANSDGTR